jgi:type II secretion system protein N
MLKRLVIICILFAAGSVFFIAIVLALFPAGPIADFIVEKAEAESGIRLRYDSFERVFPFGIEARGIEVVRPGERVDVKIEKLRLRLKPALLLRGRVALFLDADILGGSIDGTVTFGPGGVSSDIWLRSLRPELLSLSREFAVGIPFAFSGSAALKASYSGCVEGVVTVDSDKAGIDAGSGTVSALGFGLDFGTGAAAGLRATLKECRAEVKGLWIEGPDLVARLVGQVHLDPWQGGRNRLKLFAEVNDLTLKGSNRLLLSFLKRYELRQGYYAIDITGTVARPRVQRRR